MKKVTVTKTNGDVLLIEGPEDKEMVFDPVALQHGVLVIGEYGASGTKVAAFKDWSSAFFLNGDEGYTLSEANPF